MKADPSLAVVAPRDYDALHTALQLLREAYDLQVNPESHVDYRDWKRATGTLLDAHGLTTIEAIDRKQKKRHDDDLSRVLGE